MPRKWKTRGAYRRACCIILQSNEVLSYNNCRCMNYEYIDDLPVAVQNDLKLIHPTKCTPMLEHMHLLGERLRHGYHPSALMVKAQADEHHDLYRTRDEGFLNLCFTVMERAINYGKKWVMEHRSCDMITVALIMVLKMCLGNRIRREFFVDRAAQSR